MKLRVPVVLRIMQTRFRGDCEADDDEMGRRRKWVSEELRCGRMDGNGVRTSEERDVEC